MFLEKYARWFLTTWPTHFMLPLYYQQSRQVVPILCAYHSISHLASSYSFFSASFTLSIRLPFNSAERGALVML
jgi:hypothetical protein